MMKMKNLNKKEMKDDLENLENQNFFDPKKRSITEEAVFSAAEGVGGVVYFINLLLKIVMFGLCLLYCMGMWYSFFNTGAYMRFIEAVYNGTSC